MISEPSPRTIILNLLRGAVPEKAEELCRLWVKFGHDVEVAPSAKGATMNATSRRIKFDTKTIDLFWLVGFSVWYAIELYTPAIMVSTCMERTVEDVLNDDHERPQLEADYRQRLSAIKALLDANGTGEVEWPDDIPMPTDDRAGMQNDQERAVFDLVSLALAFALLHELKHVIFSKTGDAPTDGAEEEMSCDTWARMTMTSSLAEYARNEECNFADVEQKRATGIALAAIVVHAMTTPSMRWGGDEYPPIAARLTALIDGYGQPSNSNFWLYTACLLVALMREDRRPLAISSSSYKELVETLLAELA